MYRKPVVWVMLVLVLNSMSDQSILDVRALKRIFMPLSLTKFSIEKKFNTLNIQQFKRVPLAEDLGIVTNDFLLEIEDAIAPYNPGVSLEKDNIVVVYREDHKNKFSTVPFTTTLKRVNFDKNFNQISDSFKIIPQSKTAEDPRLINICGNNYLIYNDLKSSENKNERVIYLEQGSPHSKLKLELGINFQEKNWSPFEYNGELHFIYKITPHVIMKLSDAAQKEIQLIHNEETFHVPKFWRWGEPRGGTPAILVDGEYLTFFHSSFRAKDKLIYVMGAYTFESKPPFNIKKFSRFPIIFKNCYSAPLKNTADQNKRVIFPTGLIRMNDKLYLFCGENDCAIRVLEIDTQSLQAIMADINLEPNTKSTSRT